ncbi:uncharacterized protein N7459_002370 [Penicillium hispanicum]|uniref:uncharacterized protein n=1 Tax=Penicillium hispanicum TaxID=1080232 RepID=UPI002542311E|nr:uncharacterized protein N7459_002370 [Penicillium hispanicum]KAJ5592001.1 hypothetical protein N7459_002370 [Penicillium hispanicum]
MHAKVKLLLKTPGIQVNWIDRLNRTPLFMSILEGFDEAAEILIKDPHVSLEMLDHLGMTPLQLVIVHRRAKVVNLILQAGGFLHGPVDEDSMSTALAVISGHGCTKREINLWHEDYLGRRNRKLLEVRDKKEADHDEMGE